MMSVNLQNKDQGYQEEETSNKVIGEPLIETNSAIPDPLTVE